MANQRVDVNAIAGGAGIAPMATRMAISAGAWEDARTLRLDAPLAATSAAATTAATPAPRSTQPGGQWPADLAYIELGTQFRGSLSGATTPVALRISVDVAALARARQPRLVVDPQIDPRLPFMVTLAGLAEDRELLRNLRVVSRPRGTIRGKPRETVIPHRFVDAAAYYAGLGLLPPASEAESPFVAYVQLAAPVPPSARLALVATPLGQGSGNATAPVLEEIPLSLVSPLQLTAVSCDGVRPAQARQALAFPTSNEAQGVRASLRCSRGASVVLSFSRSVRRSDDPKDTAAIQAIEAAMGGTGNVRTEGATAYIDVAEPARAAKHISIPAGTFRDDYGGGSPRIDVAIEVGDYLGDESLDHIATALVTQVDPGLELPQYVFDFETGVGARATLAVRAVAPADLSRFLAWQRDAHASLPGRVVGTLAVAPGNQGRLDLRPALRRTEPAAPGGARFTGQAIVELVITDASGRRLAHRAQWVTATDLMAVVQRVDRSLRIAVSSLSTGARIAGARIARFTGPDGDPESISTTDRDGMATMRDLRGGGCYATVAYRGDLAIVPIELNDDSAAFDCTEVATSGVDPSADAPADAPAEIAGMPPIAPWHALGTVQTSRHSYEPGDVIHALFLPTVDDESLKPEAPIAARLVAGRSRVVATAAARRLGGIWIASLGTEGLAVQGEELTLQFVRPLARPLARSWAGPLAHSAQPSTPANAATSSAPIQRIGETRVTMALRFDLDAVEAHIVRKDSSPADVIAGTALGWQLVTSLGSNTSVQGIYWKISETPTVFSPPGRDAYWFGVIPTSGEYQREPVAQTAAALLWTPKRQPYPYVVTPRAEVELRYREKTARRDVERAYQAEIAGDPIVVHPSDLYVGIAVPDPYGAPDLITLIAVNPKGETLVDIPLCVRIDSSEGPCLLEVRSGSSPVAVAVHELLAKTQSKSAQGVKRWSAPLKVLVSAQDSQGRMAATVLLLSPPVVAHWQDGPQLAVPSLLRGLVPPRGAIAWPAQPAPARSPATTVNTPVLADRFIAVADSAWRSARDVVSPRRTAYVNAASVVRTPRAFDGKTFVDQTDVHVATATLEGVIEPFISVATSPWLRSSAGVELNFAGQALHDAHQLLVWSSPIADDAHRDMLRATSEFDNFLPKTYASTELVVWRDASELALWPGTSPLTGGGGRGYLCCGHMRRIGGYGYGLGSSGARWHTRISPTWDVVDLAAHGARLYLPPSSGPRAISVLAPTPHGIYAWRGVVTSDGRVIQTLPTSAF